jgi:uncharacterized membrane protein YbhN (UPF0104 family)
MSSDVDLEYKTRGARQLILRIIIPLGITILLISFLLHFSDPRTIFQLVLNSAFGDLIVAFGLYICVYLIRALRFQQFPMLNRISTWNLIPIVSLHGFINLILPMRSGELSLVYLLRKFHKTEIGSGMGILLLVRLFDLVALVLCLTGGLVLVGSEADKAIDPWLLVIPVLLGVMITVISLTAGRWWRFLVDSLSQFGERMRIRDKSWCQVGFVWMDEIGFVLESSKRLTFSIRLLATSLASWLFLFFSFWLLLQAVGITRFSYPEVVIGSTGAAITSALPINAIGNFGTLQVGWTVGFSALGMSAEEGIASGFAIHIFILIFSSILALASYLFLTKQILSSRRSDDQAK